MKKDLKTKESDFFSYLLLKETQDIGLYYEQKNTSFLHQLDSCCLSGLVGHE